MVLPFLLYIVIFLLKKDEKINIIYISHIFIISRALFSFLLDKTSFTFSVLKSCPSRWFCIEKKAECDLSYFTISIVHLITKMSFIMLFRKTNGFPLNKTYFSEIHCLYMNSFPIYSFFSIPLDIFILCLTRLKVH